MRSLPRLARVPLRPVRLASIALTERLLRIDTRGYIGPDELSGTREGCEGYEGSGWLDLRRILPRHEVSPQDVLLDLGSGKGRALLMAARYPFARIIGVEHSEQLAEVARRNVAALPTGLRPERIEVVTGDVLAYQVPDDVTVVYLYNPFRGQTFAAMMRRLIASVDRAPRTVRIIYLNAQEHDQLLATRRIRLARVAGRILKRDPEARAYIRLYELDPVPLEAAP